MKMEKHFVTFLSPGTFVAEESTKEIPSWDVDLAVQMSKQILERYDSRPYAFRFTTRSRGEQDFDSKESARSGLYFLGGEVLTLEQVKAENDPGNRILIGNMECNGYSRIVRTRTPHLWCQPLKDDDQVLNLD